MSAPHGGKPALVGYFATCWGVSSQSELMQGPAKLFLCPAFPPSPGAYSSRRGVGTRKSPAAQDGPAPSPRPSCEQWGQAGACGLSFASNTSMGRGTGDATAATLGLGSDKGSEEPQELQEEQT